MPATRRQSTRLAAHSSAVQAASPTSTSFRPQSHHAGRRRSSVFTPSTSRRGSLVDAFQPPLPCSTQVSPIDQLPKAAARTFAPAPHEPAPCTTSKSKRVQIAAKKKGEGYIPRSPNCFLMFRNWMISEGKIPTGIMNNTTVSKVISAAWKLCSDEEKAYWRDLAAKAKYEHSLKYPEYRYQPKHQPRSQKGKEAREKAMAKPKSAPVQKDGSVLMNPARPFGRPSKKNRGKLTNPHQDARNEAQAQFVQSVLRDNLSQGELEVQLEEFLAEWDRQHPVESFPEFYSHMLPKEQLPVDLPYPLQESGEAIVPMPDASQLPAMDPLLYPSSSSSRYGSPNLQAPELHQPQATRPVASWVMGAAPTIAPRRSLSVQPGDMGPLNYPAAPFFTDSIQEAVAPSNQTRAWLGHRRSSSVGALQYADMSGNARRPSTAQVLYPNAWHGPNDFLPAPTSTYQTQPMAHDDIQLRPIIFNDPFSPAATTSHIEKPTLAPLSVAPFAPHQVDAHLETSLRRLSLFNKMEMTGPYSAGGAFGGNSSVPSSTFSQSQRSSPDSFAPSSVPVYNYGAALEQQQPVSSYQDFSGFPAMYSVKNEEYEFDAAASGWHASAPSSASPEAGMEPIDCDMLDDYMQFPLAHDLHETSSSL